MISEGCRAGCPGRGCASGIIRESACRSEHKGHMTTKSPRRRLAPRPCLPSRSWPLPAVPRMPAGRERPLNSSLPPTFRTRSTSSQVDAVVLDAQGRFVPDLRQDDFEVLEDGKPQRLASTQVVNIPVERVETPLFAARAHSSRTCRPTPGPSTGGSTSIVLDDLHTAPNRSQLVRTIAADVHREERGPERPGRRRVDLGQPQAVAGAHQGPPAAGGRREPVRRAKVVSPGLAGQARRRRRRP